MVSLILTIYGFIGATSAVGDKLKVGIVGGKRATRGELSYLVSLQYKDRNICGAGLLSKDFIISAAHCVIDEKGFFHQRQLIAVIGAIDLNDLGNSAVKIPTIKIYVPKDFKRELVKPFDRYRAIGDIAVLKLQVPIEARFRSKLTMLRLPSDPSKDYDDKKVIIGGFGYNEVTIIYDPQGKRLSEEGRSDGKLYYAKAKVVPIKECDELTYHNIVKKHICAKAKQYDDRGPAGVCNGDSGGPLVRNGKTVIGILSSSPATCNESKEPAVYTRVSSFKFFVENAMKDKVTLDMRVANWFMFDENCLGMLPHLHETKVGEPSG